MLTLSYSFVFLAHNTQVLRVNGAGAQAIEGILEEPRDINDWMDREQFGRRFDGQGSDPPVLGGVHGWFSFLPDSAQIFLGYTSLYFLNSVQTRVIGNGFIFSSRLCLKNYNKKITRLGRAKKM